MPSQGQTRGDIRFSSPGQSGMWRCSPVCSKTCENNTTFCKLVNMVHGHELTNFVCRRHELINFVCRRHELINFVCRGHELTNFVCHGSKFKVTRVQNRSQNAFQQYISRNNFSWNIQGHSYWSSANTQSLIVSMYVSDSMMMMILI